MNKQTDTTPTPYLNLIRGNNNPASSENQHTNVDGFLNEIGEGYTNEELAALVFGAYGYQPARLASVMGREGYFQSYYTIMIRIYNRIMPERRVGDFQRWLDRNNFHLDGSQEYFLERVRQERPNFAAAA
ncbi:MAG: hypothetical protein QM785_12355 [Pyrinomonadaceae bacterium]